jgi:diaminopimelate decarboxylase
MLMEIMNNEWINHSIDFDETDFYVDDPLPLEEFSKEISKAINKYVIKNLNKNNIKISYEPGQFITKHSTFILTKVLAVKNQKSIIVDAGTLTMRGGYGLANYEYAPIINISKPSPTIRKENIYGSLCEPSDIWGYRYYGEQAQPGDIMAILNQGAYTFSFSQRFIKPGAPYIVITKDNKLVVARKRESFEDRYK